MGMAGPDDKKAVDEPKAEQKAPDPAGPVVPYTPPPVSTPDKDDSEPDSKTKVQVEVEDKKKPKKKDEEEEEKPEVKNEENYGEFQWIIDMIEENQKIREEDLKKANANLENAEKVLKNLEDQQGADPKAIEEAKKDIIQAKFDVEKYTTGISLFKAAKNSVKKAADAFKGKVERGKEVIQTLKESIQQAAKDVKKEADKLKGIDKQSPDAENQKALAEQGLFGALRNLVKECVKALKVVVTQTKEKPSELKTEIAPDLEEKTPETRQRRGGDIEMADLDERKSQQPTDSQPPVEMPETPQAADSRAVQDEGIELTDLGKKPPQSDATPSTTSELPQMDTPALQENQGPAVKTIAATHVCKNHVIIGPPAQGREFPEPSTTVLTPAEGVSPEQLVQAVDKRREESQNHKDKVLSATVQDDGTVSVSGAKSSLRDMELELQTLTATPSAPLTPSGPAINP